jgi:hypothetical protein
VRYPGADMPRSFAILAAALLAALESGCGTQCDRHPNEPPVEFKDGVTDQAAHIYVSSSDTKNPWKGPWLDFPPGRTFRFPHQLGGVPRQIDIWFSFSPNPIADNPEGESSGFVAAAGNQATVQFVDDDHIDIRNDTCSDVWIMVSLSEPKFESTREAGVSGDAAAP